MIIIHPMNGWSYTPRWVADRVREDLEAVPIVVLTGARQVGKSTLLRHEPPFQDGSITTFTGAGLPFESCGKFRPPSG